ncbi:MAG: hypothetical protein KA204_11255 [Chromatiaceae bacterium]|nr:hypothetical protein [Chromatiaceae bacterium]MBP6734481.1 hypothetical protein [Chromatiaceae bacterium]MBP6807746.1 hypothetical protein [Chromatiaceae bacterium]MBP8289636.1 hypothetical protein [Chromatiaceae bacterium]MBP9604061.1 hypothetical protein [Chromatiaceae bacterium]
MDRTTPDGQGVGSRAASSDPGRRAAVPQEATLLWQALCGLAHDRLELAALETQRAGESLVAMVVAGMLVAGLVLRVCEEIENSGQMQSYPFVSKDHFSALCRGFGVFSQPLSAWLGVLGAAMLALISLGIMATVSALLLAVSLNLVIALKLWRHIGRLSHDLRFPANGRSLEPAASQCQEGETS